MLKRVKDYFSGGKKNYKEVYCQSCGREITYERGHVTEGGSALCHEGMAEPAYCQNRVFFDIDEKDLPYLSPKEMQKAIKAGDVIHYGKLERAAAD